MSKKMICVDLNDASINHYKETLKSWNWDTTQELHLVHGFQLQIYADTFFFNSYPLEDQYDQIEESVNQVLSQLASELDFGKDLKIFTKCIISSSPKKALADYAQEQSIDEMIISTRGKHGIEALFSSSFAEYMIRYAPCELRIIRSTEV
jgi:nucleotide-binding universal stress UspA family protein